MGILLGGKEFTPDQVKSYFDSKGGNSVGVDVAAIAKDAANAGVSVEEATNAWNKVYGSNLKSSDVKANQDWTSNYASSILNKGVAPVADGSSTVAPVAKSSAPVPRNGITYEGRFFPKEELDSIYADVGPSGSGTYDSNTFRTILEKLTPEDAQWFAQNYAPQTRSVLAPRPTPGVSEAAGYAPTTWSINPATDTVEGRLTGLMRSSPLRAQIEADTMKAANARGLMNTSLAVTAAEDALLRSSVPIATSDAATYANAGQFNAGQENAARAFTAGAQNTASIQNAGNQTQASIAGAQIDSQREQQQMQNESQMRIAQLNANTQTAISKLDNASRTSLQQMENQHKTTLQGSSAASAYFNQAVTAISNIQMNGNMDAAAKETAINNILEQTKAGLADQSAVLGFDISRNFSQLATATTSAQTTAPVRAPAAEAAPTQL